MNAPYEFSAFRHNFFRQKNGGTLRFSEHSPHKTECEHQVCNCTKAVTKRPEGKPFQVSQGIKVSGGNGRFEMTAGSGASVNFTFLLPTSMKSELDSPDQRPHAYFHFGKTFDLLRIEITKPHYGLVDCFFGHLYFGNQVDISTLMNGHSPSRVVNLSRIEKDDVWCHSCCSGRESWMLLPARPETEYWRKCFSLAKKISSRVRIIERSRNPDLDRICISLGGDDDLVDEISSCDLFFESILENLEKTVLFECCDSVDRDTYPRKKSITAGLKTQRLARPIQLDSGSIVRAD